MTQINSIDGSIDLILAKKAEAGQNDPRITNEEMLGISKARDPIRKQGWDLEAKHRRDEINPILEDQYGIGLIPDDFRGTWRIVDVGRRARYLVAMRARRAIRLVSSTMEETLLNYSTHPHIRNDDQRWIEALLVGYQAIDQLIAVAIVPQLQKMDDDDEEDVA